MGDPLVSCVREKQKKSGLVSKSLLKMHRCSFFIFFILTFVFPCKQYYELFPWKYKYMSELNIMQLFILVCRNDALKSQLI